MPTSNRKTCRRCGEDKEPALFSPSKANVDGRHSWCRECFAAYMRDRRKIPAINARDRMTSAGWKRANPERARASSSNPEKRAREKERRKTPEGREYWRAVNAARRARKRESGGSFSPIEWREVLAEFHHRCGYCLADDVPLEMDHVEPLARGGRHARENIVPACQPCNRSKNKSSLLEFVRRAPRSRV